MCSLDFSAQSRCASTRAELEAEGVEYVRGAAVKKVVEASPQGFPSREVAESSSLHEIRGILRQLDPASVEAAFRRHAAVLNDATNGEGQRHVAIGLPHHTLPLLPPLHS